MFRGPRRWQRGDGFGDILRGVARFMLPVVLRGAATFAGETLDANERGESLGSAAKNALKPALQAAVQAVAEGFQGGAAKPEASKLTNVHERQAQRKHKSKSSKSSKNSKNSKRKSSKSSKSGGAKQTGKGREKASAKRVYKTKPKRNRDMLGGALTQGLNRVKAASRKLKASKHLSFASASTNF